MALTSISKSLTVFLTFLICLTKYSLLNNDLYKFTMMHAAWKKYPDATVRYRFINLFDEKCVSLIREHVSGLNETRLNNNEADFLRSLEIFEIDFINFLKNFHG